MESVIARGIQVLLALAGAYVVALWFVLIVWTFRDIETRSRSVVTQIFSTLLVVLFFVPGVLLYLILRPKETLDVAFQRTLEEEYLLQDLEELPVCVSCQHYIEDDFMICPNCQGRLREPCPSCARLVDVRWAICPYCEADQSRTTVEVEQAPEQAARWIAPTALRRRMLNREGRSVAELEPPAARIPATTAESHVADSESMATPPSPMRLFDRRKTRETAAVAAQSKAATNGGGHGSNERRPESELGGAEDRGRALGRELDRVERKRQSVRRANGDEPFEADHEAAVGNLDEVKIP